MGEIAEMMLDGTLCSVCGEFLGHSDGYPVTCFTCSSGEPVPPRSTLRQPASRRQLKPWQCGLCSKKPRFALGAALKDHMRDKHGVTK